MSKFECLFHGKMVDKDIAKPFCVILKYVTDYYGYWTGEDVVIQVQDNHITFIKRHPGCLPVYVFNNSAKHHKIATDALNARTMNLNYRG